MQEKSKTETNNSDLQEIFNKHTDEQILEILKKREHYQPEAVDVAVKEAISRKLIHSEQDLFSPEFSPEPLKRKLIPEIHREKNKNRIRKSLGRSLLIAGVLPLIFGFVRYNSGQLFEGIGILVFGLTWMFLSAQIIRKGSKSVIHLLLGIAFASLIYVGYLFADSKSVIFMDVFIIAVLYLLVFYGLFFVRKLVE
ncbi:MAG TPA: hypothetical protein VJ919_01935 [Tangfeifania sp.]|nr:hypothetical protein [Tangfeifania sp.]